MSNKSSPFVVCDHPSVCQPTAHGCGRCDASPGASRQAALLLGAQDHNADETLRQALDTAGIAFTRVGSLMHVPATRSYLGELAGVLKSSLNEYTLDCIRAAYAPTGAMCPEHALAAFIFAEPLTQFVEHATHEWVRDALANEWLFSVFHPIIGAATGELFAQECLIRAREPQSGKIFGAGQLIGACEALNIQHQLDQRARVAAIRGGSEHVGNQTKLFINFLPNTIYDPKICLRTTMEAAKKYNVALSRLVFEVVETEKIGNMKQLLRILNYYRERGVGTAVDDMGAGFASIEYIQALQPHFVKLDRDLVVRAEMDPEARKAIDAVVEATHAIHGKVIAEGIETPGQHHLVIQAGCDFVQGFMFCKPACPPSVAQFPKAMRVAA